MNRDYFNVLSPQCGHTILGVPHIHLMNGLKHIVVVSRYKLVYEQVTNDNMEEHCSVDRGNNCCQIS